MNDTIEQAILEAFGQTNPKLAQALKDLRSKHAPKHDVIKRLTRLKVAPLLYESALLYVEHLWWETNGA